MKTGFTYSLLLHALFFLMLAGGIKGCAGGGLGFGNSDKEGQKDGVEGKEKEGEKDGLLKDDGNGKIQDKFVDVELIEVPPALPEDGLVKAEIPKSNFTDRDCGKLKWFGGIGITMEGIVGRVIVKTVHKGYPAQKAGVKEGDILYNYDNLKGDPGTEVTVLIGRGKESFSLKMIREKICTIDEATP